MHLKSHFSYLIIKKGEICKKKSLAENIHQETLFWDRMVGRNGKHGKHITLKLCSTDGTYEERVIAKSHGLEGGWKWVNRAKWGDLWPFPRRIPNRFRKMSRKGKRLW
jgi:ribosomal protein RSM22 (predicted rRNA methylase)